MKKLSSALTLIFALFYLLLLSNPVVAEKAAWVFSVETRSDVSFIISDMDGAFGVRIEARVLPSGSYETVTTLGSITSTGTYSRTAQQWFDQFGYGSYEARLVDNGSLAHFSDPVSFSF